MTPEELVRLGPASHDDLIGKAKVVAKMFCSRIESGNRQPIKLLCYGDPGIGKTAVCRIIANQLVRHSSMIRRVSAVGLTTDMMRDWMWDLRYQNRDWRVYWVEEVDAISPATEVLMLQFLDDMPEQTAALFTSNEAMSGISGRFQSRTQAIRFERPSVTAVEKFLLGHWPELGHVAKEIAETNNGDVRASLNDVQMQLDVKKYGVK